MTVMNTEKCIYVHRAEYVAAEESTETHTIGVTDSPIWEQKKYSKWVVRIVASLGSNLIRGFIYKFSEKRPSMQIFTKLEE